MAEVLSLPLQSNGPSHFGSSSLQRSSSHSSLLLQNPSLYPSSTSSSRSGLSNLAYDNRLSNSLPSSAPSSPRLSQPRFSNQPSYTSTPSSSLSLDDHCAVDDEDIHFPSYGTQVYPDPDHRALDRPTSPKGSPSPVEATSDDFGKIAKTRRLSGTGSSGLAGDDMAIQREPTRHVDYLSHNWKEEDIWSSWRHIVGRRKVYSNSTRLENASWRTWAKSKYRLKTVSPETLNWYVWLYMRESGSGGSHTDLAQDEGPRRDLALRSPADRCRQTIDTRLASFYYRSLPQQLFRLEEANTEEEEPFRIDAPTIHILVHTHSAGYRCTQSSATRTASSTPTDLG